MRIFNIWRDGVACKSVTQQRLEDGNLWMQAHVSYVTIKTKKQLANHKILASGTRNESEVGVSRVIYQWSRTSQINRPFGNCIRGGIIIIFAYENTTYWYHDVERDRERKFASTRKQFSHDNIIVILLQAIFF